MDTAQLNGQHPQGAHKRAVIYCRVSDKKQEDNYSLPSQLEACSKYADTNGFEVVGVFQDVYTAMKFERPQFDQALKMVMQHRADALIVHASNRLTRKVGDKDQIREILKRAGAELHYVSRGKLNDTPQDRMTDDMESVFDRFWRDMILESSKRGMDTKARSGKLIGGNAPYGYSYSDGTLLKDQFEAHMVEQIFKWYVIGDETGKPLTLYQIAKRLSETGVPTPGESRHYKRQRAAGMWNHNTIARILSAEVYIGVFRYGRLIGDSGKNGKRAIEDTIAIAVPALIEPDLWQAAQGQKKHNQAMSQRNAKRDYLLRGLIFCGCGRRMVGSCNGNKRYPVYVYRCNARHLPGLEDCVCQEPVHEVIGRKVEAWTWEMILDVMTDRDRFESALREAQQVELDALEPQRARLAVVVDLIRQCESEADEVAAALKQARGVVGAKLQADIDQTNKRYDELSAERDALQAAVNARVLNDADIAAALQFREDVIEGLQNPTLEDMRRMLEILQVRITVHDGRVTLACCFPAFTPSLDYLSNGKPFVNQNRWIELRRTIAWAELAARPSLADQFFAQALTPRCEVTG